MRRQAGLFFWSYFLVKRQAGLQLLQNQRELEDRVHKAYSAQHVHLVNP